MTDERVELLISVFEDDRAAVDAALAASAVGGALEQTDPGRRSDVLGPVVQYVLPAVASLGLTARTVIQLVRSLSRGVVIEGRHDKVEIRTDKALPRGIIVVRDGDKTVEIIDANTSASSVDKVTDLLRRSSKD